MMDNIEERLKTNKDFICGVVEGFYGKPWSFHQRKDLFKRLKELQLNSFMYGPKDDTKHRAKWRQLYSPDEASDLRSLIQEAKANGIDFYYSLAPGLDMVYSDPEEIETLIRKFNQIVGLGCEAFAILFDDIEPSIINKRDSEVFENYASAQVSVTNIIYKHLKEPKFLFCPTEYCESRAVPTVLSSKYLNTIGEGLMDGIDIMWSGPRVISRLITEESIATLTSVIRRPPVIWENLHANDYDKKRVFLGPYSGRSTNLISKLRGVLTNPNCEYEANFIAIHTLAQWSKCTEDVNLYNRCNSNQPQTDQPMNGQQQQQPNPNEDQSRSPSRVYDPHRALMNAIADWLPRFSGHKPLPPGIDLTTTQVRVRNDQPASNQIAKELDIDIESEANVDMVVAMVDERQTTDSTRANKSDIDSGNSLAANLIGSSCRPSSDSCESLEMQDVDSGGGAAPAEASNCNECKSDEQATVGLLSAEDLLLLVDLYYLPFEHGPHGCAILNDMKWLIDNSDILAAHRGLCGDQQDKTNIAEPENRSSATQMVEFWLKKAENLNNLCTSISRLVNILIDECPNKLLIIELYPYLVDMRDLISTLVDYIKYLRHRSPTLDGMSSQRQHPARQKEPPASGDDQEPWAHRGGMIGDVHRLLS